MMENQNTFDMTENIPDEMFEIIGLEKDEEVPARPRIGYWADAWRRFKENKVALLAGVLSELWVQSMKSRYENICLLYDYLLLIFGYLWYNINTYNERR